MRCDPGGAQTGSFRPVPAAFVRPDEVIWLCLLPDTQFRRPSILLFCFLSLVVTFSLILIK